MDIQDRELLEFAARAMGYESRNIFAIYGYSEGIADDYSYRWWNPLTSRVDAMDIASRLGLIVDFFHERAMPSLLHASGSREWHYPEDGGENYPAICRAIVRAAAEIGRALP